MRERLDQARSEEEELASLEKSLGAETAPAEAPAEAAPEPALAPSRFQLEPALPEAWEAWVSEQMQEAGGDEGRGLFVQLQLDGTVRSSGLGTPDWDDLAQLTAKTSVVAKITGQ